MEIDSKEDEIKSVDVQIPVVNHLAFLSGNVFKNLNLSDIYVLVVGPKHFGDFYAKDSWIVGGTKLKDDVPEQCVVLVCGGKSRFRAIDTTTDPNAMTISTDDYKQQQIVGLMHVKILKNDEMTLYCQSNHIKLEKNQSKLLVIGSKVRFDNPIPWTSISSHGNLAKFTECGIEENVIRKVIKECKNVGF